MKKGILFLLVIFSFSYLNAQQTQTIRWKILDKDTYSPIIGATVIVITETEKMLGASTDLDGNYRIEGVSLGRHEVKISYIGYYEQIIPVIVNIGKEIISPKIKE